MLEDPSCPDTRPVWPDAEGQRSPLADRLPATDGSRGAGDRHHAQPSQRGSITGNLPGDVMVLRVTGIRVFRAPALGLGSAWRAVTSAWDAAVGGRGAVGSEALMRLVSHMLRITP